MTGAAMKAIREDLKLTQTELAIWLGFSAKFGKSSIAHMEAGRKSITGPVQRLMEILQATEGRIISQKSRVQG